MQQNVQRPNRKIKREDKMIKKTNILRLWPLLAVGMLLGIGLWAVTSANARQTTHDVAVENNFFNPLELTIDVGDTVRWTNNSGFHDVVSTSGPESFSSGDPGTNWEYSFTFTTPGTYEYTCTIHFGMDGTLIVQEAAQPTETATATATATSTTAPTETPLPTLSGTATPDPNLTPRGFLALIWQVETE